MHFVESAGKHKQLLKNEAPPRKLQRYKIRREMDVFICKAALHKTALFPHRVRQHIRQSLAAQPQTLTHGIDDVSLSQPRAHPVHGHDAPRHGIIGVFALVYGIGHRAASARHLDPAVEAIALALYKLIPEIILVEIRYIDGAAVVHGAELHKLHTAPDAHKLRRVRDYRLYAARHIGRRLRDRDKHASVFVFSREVRNKVIERKDPKLIESQRLFLPYSFYISYVCIKRRHVIPCT